MAASRLLCGEFLFILRSDLEVGAKRFVGLGFPAPAVQNSCLPVVGFLFLGD